jgi:hypothetical protein
LKTQVQIVENICLAFRRTTASTGEAATVAEAVFAVKMKDGNFDRSGPAEHGNAPCGKRLLDAQKEFPNWMS